MTTQKTPWDLDVRVRERNLRKGVLDDKDIEKYLRELPDAAANAENVTIPQPAVGNGAAAAAAVSTPPPAPPAPAVAPPPAAAPAAQPPVPPAGGGGLPPTSGT